MIAFIKKQVLDTANLIGYKSKKHNFRYMWTGNS